MNIIDEQNITEQELWRLFQQGDESAFNQLYRKYVQVVYSYGRKFSSDEGLIEDCIHNLFLDLWKNRQSLSIPTCIRFYLYACVKRRIHKEVTKQKTVCVEDFTDLKTVHIGNSASAEEQLINAQSQLQQKESLLQAISLLSGNQQRALYMKFYEDLSFQEISAAMHMSTDNIYKLVSRGLAILRRM